MIDIKHVAKLANLIITPAQEKKFSEQISRVLEYAEKISELDTQGVQSKGQLTLEENRFREDKIQPERILSQSEALGQAKQTHDGFFIVKAVIDKA